MFKFKWPKLNAFEATQGLDQSKDQTLSPSREQTPAKQRFVDGK